MDITYNHTIAMRMYRIRIKASNKMQTNKPACPHAQMGVWVYKHFLISPHGYEYEWVCMLIV